MTGSYRRKEASYGNDTREPGAPDGKRRWAIWEVPGNLQCSIIGTCLAQSEILKLARKLDLQIEPGTADYDIHAYFVREASQYGKTSRLIQKELERRFSGMVRRVGRLSKEAELVALWEGAYESGQIPGAYWALLTHTHVPPDLRKRAFGEVHMLSHILGRTTHQAALKASDLGSRLEELEDKLLREADRQKRAIERRDRQIAALKADLLAARGEQQPNPATSHRGARGNGRTARLLLSRERALISARQRARDMEAQNAKLQSRLDQLERDARRARLTAVREGCPGAEACQLELPPRKVLYLGGRPNAIDRLKSIAEEINAEMFHHDGGVEQTVELIDGLVTRCDVVFCPIDCVSHGACERAKALCRKFEKPFVPLRSSGASSFKRALLNLEN